MGQRLAVAATVSLVTAVVILAVMYYYYGGAGPGSSREQALGVNVTNTRIYCADDNTTIIQGELLVLNKVPRRIVIYGVSVEYIDVRWDGHEKTYLGGNISMIVEPEPPITLSGKGSSRLILYRINIPCIPGKHYTVEYRLRLSTNQGAYTATVETAVG